MQIRGGALVVRTLREFGIDLLFSLPGHQTLSMFDACIDEGINLVSTRHEASAVYMAEGIAYASRDIGVALLAGGPELTNALTGIAKAFYAGTPLIVIAGTNTMRKLDKGFPQDMPQLEVVRPFTKWCRGCYDARRIPEYIAAAYRHAVQGRPGPVYLEIPYDVLEDKVSEVEVAFLAKPQRVRSCGDAESIREAARLIANSEKPIAVAGSGAFWSGAETELQEFVENSGVPLLLTNGALSLALPPDLVWAYGSPGVSRFSMRAIAEADVVVLLGTRVNFSLGFGQEPFMSARQKVIQFEAEPAAVGEHRPVDVSVLGDLRESLRYLNHRDVKPGRVDAWRASLAKRKAGLTREIQPLRESDNVPIHPLRLVGELERARTEETILVLDGANSVLWALLAMQTRRSAQTLLSPMGSLEAIGAGVPHALALKAANPDKPVILYTGDGSLGYGAMEFETAVRCNLPIVVVVHNDQGWGMTRDMQAEFYGRQREIGNRLGLVRYDQVARALGGHGELVEQPRDIGPAIERALRSGLPACVNVVVDPRPKSPGLMMFMLMEVMLGKKTYDRVPELMRRMQPWHLDERAARLMLRYIERKLHRELN